MNIAEHKYSLNVDYKYDSKVQNDLDGFGVQVSEDDFHTIPSVDNLSTTSSMEACADGLQFELCGLSFATLSRFNN